MRGPPVTTDATNILIPGMARVWLAPVGTVAPDGPTVSMPTGWKDVGLFTPDSLSWATDPSFEAVNSHQSNYPTRRFQTSDAATVQVDLQEWKGDNLKAVYGGGTITEVTPSGGGGTPYFRFSPPSIGQRTSVAVCIEIIDGTHHLRRIVPRAEQTEGVSTDFNKTAESLLPLRLSVLGGDIGDPWYDISDIASWDPVP
jgi:hypothetical protein